MTIAQDNVARFTQRAADSPDDPRIARERTTAVRDALTLILAGKRGRAEYVLARSLRRQLAHAGIGDLQLGPGTTPYGVGPHPAAIPPAPRHRKAHQ